MKKYFFSFCSAIAITIINMSYAQTVEFTQSEFKYESSKEMDKQVYIGIKITGQVAVETEMQMSISRNDKSASYFLPQAKFKVGPNATQLEIPFAIKRVQIDKTDTITISFEDVFAKKIRTAQIFITPPAPKAKDHKDGRIMLLNAYNFDFGGNLNGSNYVGHLNIFSPSMGDSDKWGFNTGIMKINYSQKDTALESSPVAMENFFINHFDTIGVGLKYLRRVSRYSTIKKNQVWSFYFQPFYQLNDVEDKSRILLQAHVELVASKWTATTTSSAMFQDTAVITTVPPQGFVIRHNYNTKSVLTINSLSAYLGGGFTYDMKLWNKGEFFISGTMGLTSNTPSPSSTDIDTFIFTGSKERSSSRNWRSFYLIRANYIQKLSENAQIVIGMDVRGFLKNYAPQYAAYVGLNVGLDSILKLITGDKKE